METVDRQRHDEKGFTGCGRYQLDVGDIVEFIDVPDQEAPLEENAK